MANVEFELLCPAAETEWHLGKVLIEELVEWDVLQSEGLGFARDQVIAAFYPDSMETIRRNSAAPDGRFLLAMGSGGAAGCAAFRRLNSETCELYDVFVRHTFRGCGIGSLLVGRLQRDAVEAGYKAMYLETATFMHDAHRLYRSHQFEVREHYRTVPEALAGSIISMQCDLSKRAERVVAHEA